MSSLQMKCRFSKASMQQNINQVRSLLLHGIGSHMQNNDNIHPGVESELPVGLCFHGPREFG